jgi:serine/threonine protein phosphatase 1
MSYIMGNHDWWLLQWLKSGHTPAVWTSQGGIASIRSYQVLEEDQQVEVIHRHMISTAWYWEKQLHSHPKNIEITRLRFGDFEEIFIGHTPTSRLDYTLHPMKLSNLWALDQGAGWEGKLTLMDVDTHEYWQSAMVAELYTGLRGRG